LPQATKQFVLSVEQFIIFKGDNSMEQSNKKLVVAFPALDEEKKQQITDHVSGCG
jgi:hypothetical protein